MAVVRITDRDLGFGNLKKLMTKLESQHVKVGVFGPAGLEMKTSTVGVTVDAKGKRKRIAQRSARVNVVSVATFNEFGGGASKNRPPERSFLRAGVDANKGNLLALNDALFTRMLDGRLTLEKALGLMGLALQKHVQRMITKGGEPYRKNALSTRLRKRSSRPLIDTGQLRQSIQWEVGEGKAP